MPAFRKGVNCFAVFCFHKLLRKQANMRHYPIFCPCKSAYILENTYLTCLLMQIEVSWVYKQQGCLQTALCDDSLCYCDQHLFCYHNIHLAFAHRLGSIFNLSILHSVDICFLQAMSWTRRHRDAHDRDTVFKEFIVQESQTDVDIIYWEMESRKENSQFFLG